MSIKPIENNPEWFVSAVDISALTSDSLTIIGCLFILMSNIWWKSEEPFTRLVCGAAGGDLLVGLNGVFEYTVMNLVSEEAAAELPVWMWFTIAQYLGITGATVAIIYSCLLAFQALTEAKQEHMWKYHVVAWGIPVTVYAIIYMFKPNFSNQLLCAKDKGSYVIWIGGCGPSTPFFFFATTFFLCFIIMVFVAGRIILLRSIHAKKAMRSLDTTQPRGRDSAWTRERITANKILLYGLIFFVCYTPILIDWLSHWTTQRNVGGYIFGVVISVSVASHGWLNAIVYCLTEQVRWWFFGRNDYERLLSAAGSTSTRRYYTLNDDHVLYQ